MPGYIGISSGESARSSEFWANFIRLELPPLVTKPEVARGACIAENRNKLTERALELNAEWIFYVDDDQLFDPLALNRLLLRNVDIVSGLYLARKFPFEPVVFDKASDDPTNPKGAYQMYLNNQKNNVGLIKVAATGAGALLVRRRVLEKMQRPWWTLGQLHPSGWGDDLDFCYRAKEAGFDIYCDLREWVGHKIQGSIWPNFDAKAGWSTTIAITDIPIVTLPQAVLEPEGVS
jgi:GT2 family glycosyltransferase